MCRRCKGTRWIACGFCRGEGSGNFEWGLMSGKDDRTKLILVLADPNTAKDRIVHVGDCPHCGCRKQMRCPDCASGDGDSSRQLRLRDIPLQFNPGVCAASVLPACVLDEPLSQHLRLPVQEVRKAVVAFTFMSGPVGRRDKISFVVYFYRSEKPDARAKPDDYLTFKTLLSEPDHVHIVDRYLGPHDPMMLSYGAMAKAPALAEAQRHD